MNLPVRFPKIDYGAIPARWARNLAFAHYQNATSFIPTPIEPWLIKILQRTIEKLPHGNEKLKREMQWFIAQESQHFRQHRQFNKRLIEQGYPRLAEFEQRLTDDLADFLENRSLKFLLAYADGFESLGAVAGGIWFEKSDAFLEGADPNAVALWKWHMAEEFEHRTVCFDLFHTMFGRGVWNSVVNGYFYRIYGFLFAMKHLQGYMQAMADYLVEVDRETMTDAEKVQLQRDIKAFKAFQLKYNLTQLLKNFLPWYNPARKRTPRGLEDYLRKFEPGGEYGRSPGADSPAIG